MSKFILFVAGLLAVVDQMVNVLGSAKDPIETNACWIILVLCAGFYGIISAIESLK